MVCKETGRVGLGVVVLAATWPDYDCDELSGYGWLGRVVTVGRQQADAADIEFLYAQDERGRKFEVVRVRLRDLREIVAWPGPSGGKTDSDDDDA